MTVPLLVMSASEYKRKAIMRSRVKKLVLEKLFKTSYGQYWYTANAEYVRRLVYDYCEAEPFTTKAKQKLNSIADAIINDISDKLAKELNILTRNELEGDRHD